VRRVKVTATPRDAISCYNSSWNRFTLLLFLLTEHGVDYLSRIEAMNFWNAKIYEMCDEVVYIECDTSQMQNDPIRVPRG